MPFFAWFLSCFSFQKSFYPRLALHQAFKMVRSAAASLAQASSETGEPHGYAHPGNIELLMVKGAPDLGCNQV